MEIQTCNDTIRNAKPTAEAHGYGGKAAISKRSMLPVKLTLDVVILLFLALEYQKRAISMQFHEIGGLALGCLFLVHQLLNLKWIRSVTAGIFTRKIRINPLWIVDALLTVFMAAVIITGLLISKTLPTAIQGGNSIKPWHYFCAAMAMIVTGVHLGLHWPMIKKAMWNRLPLQGCVKKWLGILLVCAIVAGGGYSFVSGSALRWLSQPFTGQPAMGDHGSMPGMEGIPGNGTDTETQQMTDASLSDAEAMTTGETANGGMSDAAQPEGMREFSDRGKAQQSGSFGSACGTILSYGSVILLFAALTAFLHSGLIAFRKRSLLKKQTPVY